MLLPSLLFVCFDPRGCLAKESNDPVVLLQEKYVFFVIVNLQARVFQSGERQHIRQGQYAEALCLQRSIHHTS